MTKDIKKQKPLTDAQIEGLIAKGAVRWTKFGRDRIYFNSAAKKIINLKLSYYKTGNISNASLDGDRISNCEAKKILASLNSSYIDVTSGKIFLCGDYKLYDFVLEALHSDIGNLE